MRFAAAIAAVVLLASTAVADLRKEVEPNDTAGTADPVASPASIGGRIDAPGDVDRYAVRLEAGQTVKADVLARGFRADNNPGSSLNGIVEVIDLDETTVLASDQSAGEYDDPFVSWTAAETGRYLVGVRDADGGGGPDHRYVLSIEIDPNGTLETATPIAPPVLPTIDALIYPATDQDYYRFDGRAAQVVTVDVDGAVFNPANPAAKIVVTLFDPEGTPIAEASYTDASADPYLEATLPTDGSYGLRVRELRSYIGTTNTFYQMTVTLGPAAGNDTYGFGTPVEIPGSASGTVSPETDLDHVRFDLAGGATVHADVDAADRLLSLLDGTATLHDASGLLATDSSNPDPLLVSSQGPGDYSVALEGPCTGSGCLPEDSYYVVFIDADTDGDGLVLPADNCPRVDNPGQADGDLDGVGDPCDVCPGVFDPEQRDADGDGVGDACPGSCRLPAETALDLAFTSGVDFGWSASSDAASYDVYRGTLDGGAWTYDHACRQSGLANPAATDADEPPVETGFYYLASARNACGTGILGFDSSDSERPNPDVCP